MFTIEVKKRSKDEEFSFEDLEMFHQECYGGRIKVKGVEGEEKGVQLVCSRCRSKKFDDRDVIIGITQTAIDGKEKGFKLDVSDPYTSHPLYYRITDEKDRLDIRIIQKT